MVSLIRTWTTIRKKKEVRMYQGGKGSFRSLIMYKVGSCLTLKRILNLQKNKKQKTRVAYILVVQSVII